MEPGKELYLLFPDMFVWQSYHKMVDQRKILEKVLNLANPRLRNFFFESTADGAKKFCRGTAKCKFNRHTFILPSSKENG